MPSTIQCSVNKTGAFTRFRYSDQGLRLYTPNTGGLVRSLVRELIPYAATKI